jgi:DNA-binding LytR/AlgR family response regulator
MGQSLMQDIVNMTVISGMALAVNQAWSGHQARGALQSEAALRAAAEARLAEGRTRPSALVPVRVGHRERMVDPGAISRIQADGNFTILHDPRGPIFVSEPIKAVVERLEPYGFVRVHKSHAVNAEAVRERRRDSLTVVDGATVPIGRAYRASLGSGPIDLAGKSGSGR